jgi:hypothetical protein
MNQKPIKEVEEERKDEGSGMDDFLAAVFFILVLPLALAKYVARWAARPFVWRVKEFKTEIRKAIVFATPLNILALFLIWEGIKAQQLVAQG